MSIHRMRFWLRRQLGRYVHARLRRRVSPWSARVPGAITLVIAPHPDDEAFGCGGLIAHRISLGEELHVAYLTDGSASHPGHPEYPPAAIASLRADEARVSTGSLGVSSSRLHFLGAPDGRLSHLDAPTREDLIQKIAGLIEAVRPDELLIASRHDGSSEHSGAAVLVQAALATIAARPRLLEYQVWSRWNPRLAGPALRHATAIYAHQLSPREAQLKSNAINVYRSQIEPLAPWHYSSLPPRFAEMFRPPVEFYFEF